MQRWLVTGGAGFIGSHVVDRLRDDENADVRVLDDFSNGLRANIAHHGSRVDVRDADLRDLDAVRSAVHGCDAVIHLGALGSVPRSLADPITTNDVNIGGTLNVLIAARDAGVERVVFSSSSSVYGDTTTLPKVESMPGRPLSPYALSKFAGEEYCRIFSTQFDVCAVTLRFFNVFGPRQRPDSQYAAVIPRWIAAMRNGERPTVHGDGTQTRDFTFVANNVDALIAAASAPADAVRGEVFNIACGARHSLLDLLHGINAGLGTAIEPVFADPRPGDVRDSHAAIDKARTAFGYAPTVAFDRGLSKTIDALTA